MDLIPNDTRGALFIFFFASWFIVQMISWLYFLGNKNIDLKRRVHKWSLIVYGTMFFFLVAPGSDSPPSVLLFVGIAVVLVVYWNIRSAIFCKNCGKVTYNRGFGRIKHCAKCGAKLPHKI